MGLEPTKFLSNKFGMVQTLDSLVPQMVKKLPVMQETQVRPLGWEDPLEKEMATQSNTLAWKNPMDGGTWRAAVHEFAKSRA